MSVAATCTTASGLTTTSTPAAMSPTARATRQSGRTGSVATTRHATASGRPRPTGLMTDAAAAAITAPQAASSHANVRRSPRKAFHTPPAAARSSGSWMRSSTIARAIA